MLSDGASTSLQRHGIDEEEWAESQANWAKYAELFQYVPYPTHFNTQAAFNALVPFSVSQRYLLLTPDTADAFLGYRRPVGDVLHGMPRAHAQGQEDASDALDASLVSTKKLVVFDHFLQRLVWLELDFSSLLKPGLPETPLAYYLSTTENLSQLLETSRRCSLAASRFLLTSFSGFSSVGMPFARGNKEQASVSAAVFVRVASFYIDSHEFDTETVFHLLGLGAMQALQAASHPQDQTGIWRTLLIWLMVRCVSGFADACGLPLLFQQAGVTQEGESHVSATDHLPGLPGSFSSFHGAHGGPQEARRAEQRESQRLVAERRPGHTQRATRSPRHQERDRPGLAQTGAQDQPPHISEQKRFCGDYAVLRYRVASCNRKASVESAVSLAVGGASWLQQYRARASEYMHSLEDTWCFSCAPPSDILTARRQISALWPGAGEAVQLSAPLSSRGSPSPSPQLSAARAILPKPRRQSQAPTGQEAAEWHSRREGREGYDRGDRGRKRFPAGHSLSQELESLSAPSQPTSGLSSGFPMGYSSSGGLLAGSGSTVRSRGVARGESTFSLEGHLYGMLDRYRRMTSSNTFLLGDSDGYLTSFVTELFTPSMLVSHLQNRVVLVLFRTLTNYEIGVPLQRDASGSTPGSPSEINTGFTENTASGEGLRFSGGEPSVEAPVAPEKRSWRKRGAQEAPPQPKCSEPSAGRSMDGTEENMTTLSSAVPSAEGVETSPPCGRDPGTGPRAMPFQAHRLAADEVSLLPAMREDMIADPLDVHQANGGRSELLRTLQRSDLSAVICYNISRFLKLASTQCPDSVAALPNQDALSSLISAFLLAVYDCGEALASQAAKEGTAEMVFPIIEAFEAFRVPLPSSVTRALRQVVRSITNAQPNEEVLARLRQSCGYAF